MRYEDTSGTFSGAAGTPDARDDADLLPQGSHAPATGNVISGAGTTTGEAGADTPGNGLVVALRGAGGTDTSDSGASLHVAGRYGTLTMDEHGNYKYVPEPRAPQGVRDVFNYTLETKDGRDTAELVINLGDRITVSENAQRIVPGPDGVVNLPPGVNLSDVHVVGRDLVVTLPDGSQIVIVDGAVFVPQLVLGGVEVPSTNLASLLIESEQIIQPGGGTPQSSGGNFDVPVPPLDPGTPLGDLIPPTELIFGVPRFEEIGQFIDRQPEAGTVSVQLDDDDVPGKNGNPGGVGDDVGAPNATTSGSLPGSGGDGSLTWDLLSSGAPAGFTYVDGPNGSILVQQVQDGNPVTVLTITIDAATGAFTVTENNPIRHATGDNENNQAFTINYTVTDSDGDTAPGTLNINVDDDTPTVSVTAGSDANVSLTTHDAATIGANSEAVSTTADFSNVFGGTSSSPGADGAGAGTTGGYALSTTGGASGLFSHGVAINLYNVGGVIVGSTSATAPASVNDASVVFSVSTTNTGIVTLTQYQQIDHTADPHPTGAPFIDDIMSLADGAITLTRSLTVVDKDGDSVTGSASVQIGANLHFVDDGPSIGLVGEGEPQLTVDETDLTINATASFAAKFSASFGADGPAANSITYALGISAPGANSGLVDVASGQPIVLVLNNGVVEGHVGTTGGALAFTVSVNATGDVTLNQILAVQHPDGTNPDDSVTLSADNLVTLTATAHDFDGDTAAATLNIGTNLHFEDDGPSVSANAGVQLDDDALAGGNPGGTGDDPDATNTSGTLGHAFGADGAGSIAYLTTGAPAGFSYALQGNGDLWVMQGANHVLTLTVNSSTGAYTVTQVAPIDHAAGLDENNVSFTIGYSVTDRDGDSATGSIVVNVDDDTPTVSANAAVQLDDDALAGGNPGGTGDDPDATNTSGTLGHSFGADGAGSVAYLTTGAPAGFSYALQGNGDLWVMQGATHVLTLTVNATTGAYTVSQVAPIDHPAGLDENNVSFTISYNVTDHDGDSATGSITINVDDDTPTVSANAGVQLDDDALAGGNPGGTGDDPNATNTSGTLAHSYGADGAGSVAYLTTGAPAGFSYALQGNGDLWVMQGATHVLTLTVNATTGAYTVSQVAPIDHPAGLDENNVSFTISYNVTDHDGDSATGSIVVNVDDDTPTVSANAGVQLDDDALAGGNPGGTGDDPNATNTSGTLAHSYGADGAGSVAYLTTGAPAGFSYALQGNGDLWVMQGATHVLTLTVNATTGAYTVSQVAPIDHPAGLDENNVSFTISYNVTDHDGDSATGSIVVNVDDDTPTVSANAAVQLDDDALAGGNPGGTGDDPNATNTSGTLAHSFGADGAGSVAYLTTGAPAGFSYALQGNGDLWVMQGATHVLTLTVNASTGAYSVSQVAPIDHPAGLDENNVSFTISYSVTDHDGDSATGSIVVNVDDDTPTVSANAAVQLDDDALAGGNPGGTGDDPNATNTSGTLAHSFGADGAGSMAYLTTGAPAGFSYALQGNGDLWVMQGATHVLTLTLNSTTGAYTVAQVAPISHPAGLDENNVSFTISYNVTDHDGDSATGSIVVNVDDDTPLANNDTDVTSNITDTADGNVITGVNTTEGAANHDSPGADGFGSITNLVGFNGSTDSNPAGGFDVNGQFGTLHMDANGNYTYTRTGGPGGATDTFTYTYVDGDGDPVSATLTITIADNTPTAGNVNVGLDDDALAGGNPGGTGDDPDSVNATGNLPGSGGDAPLTFGVLLTGAPAGFSYISGGAGIVLVQQGGVTVLTITVNSTTGAYSVVQNAPINHATGGDENNQPFTINYTVTDSDNDVANGTISISVDDDTPTVSANAGVQLDDDALAGGNPGGTGDDANATNTSGTLAHSYGADGAGSMVYLTTGAPAGFSYALQGNGDLWVMQGATHVLTLTVNSTTGAYTVTQVAPIDHPAGLDENNVSFTINYRVTDHDGDTADGSIVVNVDDDTPTVSANAAVQLDDDALAGGNPGGTGDDANATNTSGTLAHSYGADGAGSMAYLTTGAPAGFSYALQGNGDLWVMQGATHVLTLTINSTTGAYTVTQVAPIDHPAGLDENNVSFTISYSVTDHDGDSATGSIVVNVDDDTPTVSANAAVQLDDDALAGGNPGGTGDDPDATNTSGTLAHSYGADGAGSVAYLTTGAPAGFSYALQGNGDLWVMQGATHVLTLTVNSSTGAYTVSQVAPISHVAGLDENNQSFTINYRVSDSDGDTVDGSIVVNVDDDTPTVSANAGVQLDDDALAGGNPGGTGDDPNATNTSGTLAHSYGADGAGSVAYLTTGAPAGFSYALQGNGDLWVMQGADHVLTLTVNATTGAYTVTQVLPIDHPAGLDENNVSFTINYRVSDSDGDTVDGSIVVNVDDDTPTAAIGTTGQNVSVDESVGIQALDSNDTTSAGVIALFAGVSNTGTDTDLPQYAQNASAIVNSTGSSVGADAPGTTAFSLNVSAAGVDSGLNTTSGQDILLFKEGDLIVGRVSGGADDGKAAFAIAINPTTGVISMVEYLSIQHPDAANPDDSVSIANGAVLATVTVTDADSDSATQSVAIGSHIQFQDSGPVMTAAQNMNIQNSGDVAHTASFAFNLGADGANISTNDVITNVTGSATVNGAAVTNWTLTPGVENATTASYSFSFDYGIGGGNTAHETGTLVFDKVAGTYTIDLANPIQGVTTILQTATGTLFQGYQPGTSTTDSSQPEISVTQIQDLAGTANDIYVQFTSVAEPSSGTGDNNLEFYTWTPGSGNPAPVNGGGDTTWNPGQLFNQVDSWVSTSNDSNGVAGDTIQGGEVLDFNLVQGANPTGILADPSTYAQASSMFLKFDGIGSSEDMIVVLKLYDTVAHTYTTVALMVQNSDIQKGPGTGPGIYSGISLDQNDGLIVIEPNDYQQGNTNLVIVGAQIAGSDEGLTGTAIDFTYGGVLGVASTGTQPFSTDASDGPFKISSIGFTTVQTTPQNAQLDFNVTVTDGDGDSITQAISATVTPAADSVSAATIPSGNTTVAAAPLSTKSTASVADAYPTSQQSSQQTTTNSNPVLVGALAAAGLSAEPLAAHSVQGDLNSSVSAFATAAYHVQAQAPIALDSSAFSDLMSSQIDVRGMMEAQSSTLHAPTFGETSAIRAIDFGAHAPEGPGPMVQATAMPVHDQVLSAVALAGNVVMPSAQQLAGLSEGGVAGAQHNQVVAQVLADALHGGGAHGATLDALINALPNHGGAANDALASLASHNGGAVSFGDMGGFAGFSAAHIGLLMEHAVMVHQDAAPLHG